jgi:hypothetical protein
MERNSAALRVDLRVWRTILATVDSGWDKVAVSLGESAPGDQRGKLLLPLVFAVLLAGSILPIVRHSFLPLVDLPLHASQVALWMAHEVSPEIQRHFIVHLTSPYTLMYVLWRGLCACGLSIPTAGRVLVAAFIVALPCSFLFYLRARERPREWVLISFALTYDHSLAFGFLPFYMTMSLFFIALGRFALWLQRPTPVRGVATAVAGLVLLWGHGVTAGLWGIACGLLTLLRGRGMKALAVSVLPLLPTGALLALWTWILHQEYVVLFTVQGMSFTERVANIPQFLVGGFTEDASRTAEPVLLIAVLGALLAIVGFLRSRLRRAHWLEPGVADFDVASFTAGVFSFGLYFKLPFHMYGTNWVHGRFAPFGFFLMLAALPRIPWRLARGGILAGATGIAALVFLQIDASFAQFDEAIGDAQGLFASLPKGSSIDTPQNSNLHLAGFLSPVFDHFAAWAQLWTLGNVRSFVVYRHMLVEESKTDPWPHFSEKLAEDPPGTLAVERGKDALPDYLMFFTETPLGPRLPVAGSSDTYVARGRTGGLNLFSLARGR